MTDIIRYMIAYYVAGPANDLNIATRWYPYGELNLIIEDKFSIATRKFGMKVRAQSKVAGKQFLDMMIEKGAWSTTENEFGGKMHQFQADKFRAAIKELQANDPIIARAGGEGLEFWEKAFGELVA
ncbi:hypothetical protein [Novosphingobium mangrovi (ex Huang et al. 2023)]|uniref:Uncharacterized protein n=1 Tax=Novosphingobium mangrovi (ex Huang et al. 2023) TaxID=2976432 RepID=A0ABT2I8B3_9SPHN|nr:hypothetical protein [Novosphingobium mangrovi (ex Huang et al. 2023)]MCT2400828.1 hypothetical protein [Novosphingobium mangrovi (ex Huang et al. 2023)]